MTVRPTDTFKTAKKLLSSTLGARDFSSAVSGFCQAFIVKKSVFLAASAYGRRRVGLRPTPKIPAAREKNLWYPGYCQGIYKQFYFLCMSCYFQVLPYSMSSLSFFLVHRTNARETKMTTRVTVGGWETGETLVPVASLPSLNLKKKKRLLTVYFYPNV